MHRYSAEFDFCYGNRSVNGFDARDLDFGTDEKRWDEKLKKVVQYKAVSENAK